MRALYLDLSMGAAGDMLAAALLGLLPNPAAFVDKLNALGLPGVEYQLERAVKCGITGSHLTVLAHGQEEEAHHYHGDEHHHEDGHEHHHHSDLKSIRHLVQSHLTLPESVRDNVLAVYDLLAQAESQVHGVSVDQIHFHEVGTLDAVADITAVCFLMDALAPEQVFASPVHVGSGQVHCAHGILPVPAPATALLLQGIPVYGGSIAGELCTPTGAALLRHFVTKFGPMPLITPQAMGYGMGKKDFEAANCLRAILGTVDAPREEIVSLSCNLDDITAEALSYAQERLWEAGALDVYTTAIGMKKSRPGILLTCLCRPADAPRLTDLLLRHTTTLGVRQQTLTRTILPRRVEEVETPYGPVRVKISGQGPLEKRKPEYEDLARIAREQDLTISQVKNMCGF